MTDSLCFLPLDIPPLPDRDQVIQAFEESGHKEDYVWWNMELLLGARQFDVPLGSTPYDWSTSARERYHGLIQWIEDYFPFKNLYYVHLAHATKTVMPHVDENYVESPFPHHMTITRELKSHLMDNEPVGYRFLIRGDRESLYLCKKYDPNYKTVHDQTKTWCQIPEDTDSFLIRNSRVPHGVDNSNQGDRHRLTGFLLGEVDPEKHQALIEKSISRYGDCVINESDIPE